MVSTHHAYEQVQSLYFPIAIGVFALVVGVLAVFIVAGARRRRPGARSEALAIELGYAALLACVVALLVAVTFHAETPIDRTVANPSLRVEAIAAQWSWRFRYENGASVTDVSSWNPPPALVPAGVEVEFSARSRDVIHGFWLPRLRFQRQVLPGYATHFDLLFATPGLYEGECSVFCGDQHSEMHFAIRAVPQARFSAWLARQART